MTARLSQFHASSYAKSFEAEEARVGRTVARPPSLLLLVHRGHDEPDLRRVARMIPEIAPEIDVVVVPDRASYRLRPATLPRFWRPTLGVSFTPPRHFRPTLKAFCHGAPLRKSEEYARLEGAGLPVPRWTILRKGDTPRLDHFGPYVVVKPDRGTMGADVRIRRTRRLDWRPPVTNRVAKMSRATDDMIAQEFVYTGRWPVSHRVATLFGRALYAVRLEAQRQKRPLAHRWGFGEGTLSVVSNAMGSRYTLFDDPEILALAERAHAAFPELPMLGIDIVRDCETEKLYVLEVNSDGTGWQFSGFRGPEVQAAWGICFESQLDGIRKAAYVLAEETRRRAR